MSNYIDNWRDDDMIDWSEEDEELLDDELCEEEDGDEYGVIEYEYGIDENYLRNVMAPKQVESPAEFSKTPIIKLQRLRDEKIEGLIVGLGAPAKPGAQFFYTIKYWWIGKDPRTQKTVKRLVGWEVRGPTPAYYIKIPTEHIIGIYQSRGYHITSDIFIEYRIDERKGNILKKWVERRDAFATWDKPGQKEEREFRKIQEGKPSAIAAPISTPASEDKGFLGLGGFMKDVHRTLMLLIVLAIILGGIYFTAKLGILDILKDMLKESRAKK